MRNFNLDIINIAYEYEVRITDLVAKSVSLFGGWQILWILISTNHFSFESCRRNSPIELHFFQHTKPTNNRDSTARAFILIKWKFNEKLPFALDVNGAARYSIFTLLSHLWFNGWAAVAQLCNDMTIKWNKYCVRVCVHLEFRKRTEKNR